jgi:hypothetical protein
LVRAFGQGSRTLCPIFLTEKFHRKIALIIYLTERREIFCKRHYPLAGIEAIFVGELLARQVFTIVYVDYEQ